MKSDTKSADLSRGHVARGARRLPRDTLLDLKRYLALYGVAWQSACTDLCEGNGSTRGHRSNIIFFTCTVQGTYVQYQSNFLFDRFLAN